MSLDFQLSNIKDYKTKCWREDGEINAITNTLIFGTMIVGINEITNKNWKEFYARIHLSERVNGNYLHDSDRKPRYINEQDIKDHIGLATNALNETEAKYLNKLKGMLKTKLGDYRRYADA